VSLLMLKADARHLPLRDKSVQLCVTSPPYWNLRDYQVPGQIGLESTIDEYVSSIVTAFREVYRVLKPDGTLWLNIGDTYASGKMRDPKTLAAGGMRWSNRASYRRDKKAMGGDPHKGSPGIKRKDLVGMPWRVAFALQADGWYWRSCIPWAKTNCAPGSQKDRPTTSIEYIHLLGKQRFYHYDWEAIMLPASPDTHARYARGRSIKHKYADGGPGNQTIAKGFDHIPGVNPKARLASVKPAGWQAGEGSHDLVPKGNYRKGRVKANASFSASVKDVVEMRQRRESDWLMESLNGLWLDEEGDPLAMVLATEGFKGPHFATFPQRMVEPFILSGSRRGDIVLDPFGGSGTVARVAIKHGRHAVHCDLGYHELALMTRCANIQKEMF